MENELEAALEALGSRARRIRAADWPADLSADALAQPGLYSWWVDAPGAAD